MFILDSGTGSSAKLTCTSLNVRLRHNQRSCSGKWHGQGQVGSCQGVPLRAIFLSSGPSEKLRQIWLGVQGRTRHLLQLTALHLISRKARQSKIQLPFCHHDNASCTTDGFPLQGTDSQRIDRIHHIHMYLYDEKMRPMSFFTIYDYMELKSQGLIGPWTASICCSPPRIFQNEGSAVGVNSKIVHANTFSRI